MNDLGMTLAWSALQVSLLMVPAAALHALASRRGPAAGAWVAVVGLALSVAVSAATFVPWLRGVDARARPSTTAELTSRPSVEDLDSITNLTARGASDRAREDGGHEFGLSLPLTRFRGVWGRLRQGAVAPLARFRRWGGVLAVVGTTGTGVGLVRLLLGLWAVRVCRRRGTVIDDPGLIGLLDEVRVAMGCRHAVEVREVHDLVTPATAGWRRPVVLLPADWRSWRDADRRAVLAHELAHVRRGDYAAALVARIALSAHFYHPLVRWIAARLQLQQELAADAVAARVVGDRASYLCTLSRMALKQDGRSPCWPARAFLPAGGALIRRIAMLRDEPVTLDRPWSGTCRFSAGLILLGLAVGVATMRRPALSAENETPSVGVEAPQAAPRGAGQAGATPFDLRYVPDHMAGVVAFRPAATFRRTGMPRFTTLVREAVGVELSGLAKELKVDISAPGRLSLGLEDIDWVVSGLDFGKTKGATGEKLHSFQLGSVTVRTTAPFDWLRWLREWRLDFSEAREGGRVYYKVTGLMKPYLGVDPCVYLPDDRTIVFDEEKAIQKLVRSEAPAVPPYLAGPDWERASRGLLAVAINNRGGAFAERYDMGRPDDAVVLSLFQGVDRWVFGVDDADAIVLRASAACRGDAAETIARAVESLVKTARGAVEHPEPGAPAGEAPDRARRMAEALLTNLRVGRAGRSVELRAEGFGALAEFGALVAAEFNEKATQNRDGGDHSR